VFGLDGESSISGTGTDNASRTGSSGALLVRIDKTLPRVSITSPDDHFYVNTARLPIHSFGHDAASGIASRSVMLDGNPLAKRVIDLFLLPLGLHTVVVSVTDNAGNTASDSASFTVIATVSSISASIDRLLAMHAITTRGIAHDLKEKLDERPYQLRAFLHELDAQRGKKINQQAYDLLKAAALYVIAHPSRHFDGKHDEPDHHDRPNAHDSSKDESYSRR
jgi:hypothetical protein